MVKDNVLYVARGKRDGLFYNGSNRSGYVGPRWERYPKTYRRLSDLKNSLNYHYRGAEGDDIEILMCKLVVMDQFDYGSERPVSGYILED